MHDLGANERNSQKPIENRAFSIESASALELFRFKGGADGLGCVFRRGRSNGNAVCCAIVNSVVICTMGNAAAYAVNVLGNLVKRYLVHLNYPFCLVFYIICRKQKNI